MGTNTSIPVKVHFSRSTKFYNPSEQVLGNVVYQKDHDKLKLGEVFIELVGEFGY